MEHYLENINSKDYYYTLTDREKKVFSSGFNAGLSSELILHKNVLYSNKLSKFFYRIAVKCLRIKG